jgi:hypothetical protein
MRLLSHDADVLTTVCLWAPLSALFGVSRRLRRRAWPECRGVWLDIFAHFLGGRYREYSGEKRRFEGDRDAMLINDIISQYLYVFAPRYLKISQAHGGVAPPESRLEMAKWGGPILAISMLFFGWTSYPSISLWVPVLAGFGVGLSLIMLFLSLFNYIIDAYLMVAASALAASTVVRSAFGAGFPVSTSPISPNPVFSTFMAPRRYHGPHGSCADKEHVTNSLTPILSRSYSETRCTRGWTLGSRRLSWQHARYSLFQFLSCSKNMELPFASGASTAFPPNG